MKKQIFTFVGLIIVLTVFSVTAIQAQSGTTGKAHIPFDFSVGNRTIAAGDYVIETTNSVWRLRGVDNYRKIFLLTKGTELKKTMGDGELVFRRYGDQYFLAAFETSYYKIGLSKSIAERNLEKEIKNNLLAKNMISAKVEIVVIKSAI
jgi:hypothetical protein